MHDPDGPHRRGGRLRGACVAIGSQVEALIDGSWRRGTIAKLPVLHEDHWYGAWVVHCDGDAEGDHASVANVRLCPEVAPELSDPALAVPPPQAGDRRDGAADGAEGNVEAPGEATFKKGSRIEALDGEAGWRLATVVEGPERDAQGLGRWLVYCAGDPIGTSPGYSVHSRPLPTFTYCLHVRAPSAAGSASVAPSRATDAGLLGRLRASFGCGRVRRGSDRRPAAQELAATKVILPYACVIQRARDGKLRGQDGGAPRATGEQEEVDVSGETVLELPVLLLSGEFLATVRAPLSWTGAQLKASAQARGAGFLQDGSFIRMMVVGSHVVEDAETLDGLGLTSGEPLRAIVGAPGQEYDYEVSGAGIEAANGYYSKTGVEMNDAPCYANESGVLLFRFVFPNGRHYWYLSEPTDDLHKLDGDYYRVRTEDLEPPHEGWTADRCPLGKEPIPIVLGKDSEKAATSYVVSGAGVAKVNGNYSQRAGEEMNGASCYSNEAGVLLFRFLFPNGRHYWYLSARSDDLRNSAGDFYRVRTEAPSPPREGWTANGCPLGSQPAPAVDVG